MYAVLKSGGKQYRVSEGDLLRVEKLPGEAGDEVEFAEVLLVGEGSDVTVGKPLVEGARVTGTVQSQGRAKKIVITKFKRRQGYHRTMGHRQAFTEIRVTGISVG